MDAAVRLAETRDVIIATFGDLIRVPGSKSSLAAAKAEGADIRIIYSPLDCLKLAQDNPQKKVVFLSVGFETTTPVTALAVINALKSGIGNFSVLAANKTMPRALKLLAGDSSVGVDGYLYPGHVSAITGTAMYEELAVKYGVPGVVAGFEPTDILHAVITLAEMANSGIAEVKNEYARVVRNEGNPAAVEKMYEVFRPCDSVWRGLGTISASGLEFTEKYQYMDAKGAFPEETAATDRDIEPKGCKCAEILRGRAEPCDCPLFGTACTPVKPTGACMVSSEGACAAYYRYKT
jgi:hydrogenase expression/formation protein HypD